MRFELLPPVPTVALARKLREIPLFRFASVDELFRISTIASQVRYPAQASVQERGGRAQYIQVLLEGTFQVENEDGAEELVSPPAMLGFEEVLEGTTLRRKVRAMEESIALVMDSDEFRSLLSANIELAQGLFRMLLGQNLDGQAPSLITVPDSTKNPVNDDQDGPLLTVDKVMYLQNIPLFSRARAEELYELAAIAREASLIPDRMIFSEGDSPSIVYLLGGQLSLEAPSGGASLQLERGQCAGIEETLAGSRWLFRARVVDPGKALQIEREPLFDLLADHMDLLQGIFSAIFHRSELEKKSEST